MSRYSTRRSYPGAVLIVALGLAGCSGAVEPLSATLSPASGDRSVSVMLAADPAVDVTSLQLRGAGFVQVDPVPVAGSAGPDGVRFALAYGEVLCAGKPAPTVVLVGTPSGVREVPVDDDLLLTGLRADECKTTPPAR